MKIPIPKTTVLPGNKYSLLNNDDRNEDPQLKQSLV